MSVESGGQTTSDAAIPLGELDVHAVTSNDNIIQRIMSTSEQLDCINTMQVAGHARLTGRHVATNHCAIAAPCGYRTPAQICQLA